MSSSEFSYMQCVAKAEFNPASLTGTFQPLNGTGFSDSAKIVPIYNGSSTITVELSLDGVTPHIQLPPLGTIILDLQTNHYDGGTYGTGTLIVRANQIIWGRTALNPGYIEIMGIR